MNELVVRQATPADIEHVAAMCRELWPDASIEEHAADVMPLLEAKTPGHLPGVIFIAEESNRQPIGFVEVSLRSHADGCDPSHSVGYIEGWYVAPPYRRKKVGARLIAAAEEWARAQGCREMASDVLLSNPKSQIAHEALGFEVVDRCVHYRKNL
jgi:aminoglycoside 6'-N-acetyltransferase I